MKCDACGLESEFDAAFIKSSKSGLGRKTLCPACWVRRREKLHVGVLLEFLALGALGYIFYRLDPEAPIGRLFLGFFLFGLFLVLSIVPHLRWIWAKLISPVSSSRMI